MRKIPTLFLRDPDNRKHLLPEVNPECQWVLDGEGVATRKYDGTCCLVRAGKLYKRCEVKKGKTPPAGFEPATDVDLNTGKQQGWLPVGDGPEDAYHREGLLESVAMMGALPDGTYELVGPKIQGNPERFLSHALISHAQVEVLFEVKSRSFDSLRAVLRHLSADGIEGIVWHHPDGRMAKLKVRDFS